MPESPDVNVGRRLSQTAAMMPDASAVIVQRWHGKRAQYTRNTFRQLDDDSDRIARGLIHLGVRPGTRLALLVRPDERA
jgi:non-ribosomal peptide synthetase component F